MTINVLSTERLRRKCMTKFSNRLAVFMVLLVSSAFLYAQVTPAQTRGGLLYTTHCVACHTTQMHWRNDRQAIDWDSLKFQVRRWQGNAGLAWNEADIDGVSRYLNDTIYRYPTPAERVGLISASTYMSIQPTK
jgi:mono/diheme cytochrome c family protein